MNIQNLFPLGLTNLMSFQSKGLARIFANIQFKTISFSMLSLLWASLVAWMLKNLPNVGDLGWTPGLGKSPGGGYAVHGVAKSQTRPSD